MSKTTVLKVLRNTKQWKINDNKLNIRDKSIKYIIENTNDH